MKGFGSLLGPFGGPGGLGRTEKGLWGSYRLSEADKGVPPFPPQTTLPQATGLRLRSPPLSTVLAEMNPQAREYVPRHGPIARAQAHKRLGGGRDPVLLSHRFPPYSQSH